MWTATQQRRMHLQLAVTFVVCAIFCLATTASAQQPAASVQGYTQFRDDLAGRSLNFYRWSQSGAAAELGTIKRNHLTTAAVSANGEVVAGTFLPSEKSWNPFDTHVFVWSKAGGFREIAKLSLWYQGTSVDFVSDDGSIVVWTAQSYKGGAQPPQLMRWSKAGGMKDLGTPGDPISINGVSADGAEIVGRAGQHCFRWTQQGGFQDFAAMDNVLGVSTDGKVIIGTKVDSSKALRVVRWTQAGGAQDLGTLKTDEKATAPETLTPAGASADGTTIVGRINIAAHDGASGGSHAFLWTQAGGLQDFGKLGGKASSLQGVSADGTIVLGDFRDAIDNLVYFVSSVPEVMAKSQAALKQEQALAQAQAAAKAQQQAKEAATQAEELAKTAAIQADQQARYNKVIKTGRPAQLYSLAGHLEDEGRPDLAANLYQALIDRFPEDPYTAKAIEKQDAARAAAAQQQQPAQAPAGQPAAANGPSPQAAEACLQQCSSTLNSCKSDAQNQHDSAVAKGLVGLLTKNSGSVSSAAADSQSADSATSACNDAYNSCSASCQ